MVMYNWLDRSLHRQLTFELEVSHLYARSNYWCADDTDVTRTSLRCTLKKQTWNLNDI